MVCCQEKKIMRMKSILVFSVIMLVSILVHGGEGMGDDSKQPLAQADFLRIKQYILSCGKRCTYSNMYNDNPCMETQNYFFYLNPDPGGPFNHPQYNMNCDPEKGDFHTLVVYGKNSFGKDGFSIIYLEINFMDENDIRLTIDHKSPGKRREKVRMSAEKAVREILCVMDKAE